MSQCKSSSKKVLVTLGQLPEATAHCTAGLHHWVATTAVGVFQCAFCGVRGYCFACCPHAPNDAIAAPCATHRAQTERRRDQA